MKDLENLSFKRKCCLGSNELPALPSRIQIVVTVTLTTHFCLGNFIQFLLCMTRRVKLSVLFWVFLAWSRLSYCPRTQWQDLLYLEKAEDILLSMASKILLIPAEDKKFIAWCWVHLNSSSNLDAVILGKDLPYH